MSKKKMKKGKERRTSQRQLAGLRDFRIVMVLLNSCPDCLSSLEDRSAKDAKFIEPYCPKCHFEANMGFLPIAPEFP